MTLPIEEARKSVGTVISLADSQILTWINELNGTENIDEFARVVKQEIVLEKRQRKTSESRNKIKSLYEKLYMLQFKEDYVCLIIDRDSDYDRANKGFSINGIKYKHLFATTNGIKMSVVIYVSEKVHGILRQRINNCRNIEVKHVPAKRGE